MQVWAVEPPAGEMVDGLRSLDDGYVPPIFTELDGPDLLDRRPSSTPVSPSNGPADSPMSAIFAGISTGAAMAGAAGAPTRPSPGIVSSFRPTAAGSTSPPGSGPATSTRRPPGPRAPPTSDLRLIYDR